MRAVNLIPPEERRGTSAPMRTGRAPYLVIGALVAVVGAVAILVSTSNSLDDRKAELAGLEVEQRDAQARADALRPFAEFAAAHETRAATVESLARSRFDWERVLNELSQVMPGDIWLVQLAGTVSPAVSLPEAPGISIRGDVPGPALELVGCGRTQESVAGFLAALRDIDGVTRVTASKSERPEAGKADTLTSGANTGECRTRDEVSQFEIVAAFDEVAVPSEDATAAPAAPAPAPAASAPAPAPAAPAPAPAGSQAGSSGTPAASATPSTGGGA